MSKNAKHQGHKNNAHANAPFDAKHQKAGQKPSEAQDKTNEASAASHAKSEAAAEKKTETKPQAHDAHEAMVGETAAPMQNEAPQNDSAPNEHAQDEAPAEEIIDPIAVLQLEIEKQKDDFLRLQAEMQNQQRRYTSLIQKERKYAASSLLKDLLPIVDNLQSAMAHEPETMDGALKDWSEGIKLTEKLLLETLKKYELSPILALGEQFDPEKHEAIATVPVDESQKEGKIIDVIQTGYALHDRTVRAARVVVGASKS